VVRAAGHNLTADLLKEWSPSNDSDDSFAKGPPNATVSLFSEDGSRIRDAVVVLKTAKLEGDRLMFDVEVIEGDLTGGDGRASLFIDLFGFGGSHAGFGRVRYGRAGVGRVGVWNRPSVARGAWYRGATVSAATVGAARGGRSGSGALLRRSVG
jgi:hypothetical protein